MEESGLQHWLQWRLLEPVAANLAEHDLQRWGQWWQEKEGQAFWQTCEWLWQIFGQRAINALLLHIEAALPDHDPLPCWVQRWQNGDTQAFWQTCEWLWQQYSPPVSRFLFPLVDPDLDEQDRMRKVDDLANWAFFAALEEMDLIVSGEKHLTAPTGTTKTVRHEKTVRQKDGKVVTLEVIEKKKLYKGKVSERERLTERTPLEWRGVESFQSLFNDMWMKRCRDALRHEEHYYTTTKHEEEDEENDTQADPKDPRSDTETRPFQHLRLQGSRDDDSTEQGDEYEDQIAGKSPDPQTVVLDGDTLLRLIEAFAQVAEQLHHEKAEASAEIVEALILYVKREVAKTSPDSATLSDAQLRDWTIEDLLDLTNLQDIDFDDTRAWDFVQQHLKLGRDTLYKRNERLFARLRTLPQVPATLRAVFGVLWLTEMRNRVEDCHAAAQRLEKSNNEPLAQLLRLGEDYLRWIFAQGSRVHRSHSLEWVQNASPKDLFKVNNSALLTPTYPTAQGFLQFVTAHCPTKAGLLAALPRLQAAIDGLGKPRPIRLVNLIKALLQEMVSDDEDDSGEQERK